MVKTVTIPLPSDVVEGITFLLVDIILRTLVTKTINRFSEVQHDREIKNDGKVELSVAGFNLFVDRPTTRRGKVVQTLLKAVTLMAVTGVSFTTLGRTEVSREPALVVRSISRQGTLQGSDLIENVILNDFETFDNEVMWARLMVGCARLTFEVKAYEEVVCSAPYCADVFLQPNVYSGNLFEEELNRLRRLAECRVNITDSTYLEETVALELRGADVFDFECNPDAWTERFAIEKENVAMTVYSQALDPIDNGYDIECNVLRKRINDLNYMQMRCVGFKYNGEETIDVFKYKGSSENDFTDAQVDADYPWDNAEEIGEVLRIDVVDDETARMIRDSILLLGLEIDVALHYAKFQPAEATVSIVTSSMNVTDLEVWSLILLLVVSVLWVIMLVVYTILCRRRRPISALATWTQWMGTLKNVNGRADCRYLHSKRIIYGKKKDFKHLGPLARDEFVGSYDIMDARGWGEVPESSASQNDPQP